MYLKKTSIIGIIVIFILIIGVFVFSNRIIGDFGEDIDSAKNFMNKLYSMNGVEDDIGLADIKYKRSKLLNNGNNMISKTILTQKFGIDLDKHNNVIGFAKKDITGDVSVNIDVKEGEQIAKQYLKNIYDGQSILKDIKNDDSIPYYSYVFTKQQNGYNFYFEEIKVNIDKNTGFLDGYSNETFQGEVEENEFNLNELEARKIALADFEKYNKDAQILGKIDVVYASNEIDDNKKSENSKLNLCYMIVIKGKDLNDNNIVLRYFVNVSEGKIFNILKDRIEKEVKIN